MKSIVNEILVKDFLWAPYTLDITDATEIFDKDKNYWTDSYCFVEFGLE